MRNVLPSPVVTLALALVTLSCGKNLLGPGSTAFLPPRDLKALSLNSASVRLSWSSPGGTSDSVLRGYVIRWLNKEDSVGSTVLEFEVDSLSPGATSFSVLSRDRAGNLSDPNSIRWAPASRFDSALALYEYSQQAPSRSSALHIGTRSTNPVALSVDVSVGGSMDLYVFGGFGQTSQPLALWSASLFQSGFKSTKFSTVTSVSTTLDYPLSSFPDGGSFTKDTISVSDGRIYYVRILGDNQDVNYARILVRVLQNTSYPNRIITLQVSLQKTPGVPFAANRDLFPPVTASKAVKSLRALRGTISGLLVA